MDPFAVFARLIPAPVLPQIGGPPRLWLEHAEHDAVKSVTASAVVSRHHGRLLASDFCDAEMREPSPSAGPSRGVFPPCLLVPGYCVTARPLVCEQQRQEEEAA